MPRKIIPTLDPVKIQRKLRMVDELFQMAFEIKKFQLKKKFPHLTEREINHRAYALIERGCS
jgi:hypothetical protein